MSYRLELANKTEKGRAIGNEYVITYNGAIVQRFDTPEARDLWLREHTYTTEERCQYCGNRWTQRRTLGTPRLDAVPCPSCRRLV